MDESGIQPAIVRAIKAAAVRGKELGDEFGDQNWVGGDFWIDFVDPHTKKKPLKLSGFFHFNNILKRMISNDSSGTIDTYGLIGWNVNRHTLRQDNDH